MFIYVWVAGENRGENWASFTQAHQNAISPIWRENMREKDFGWFNYFSIFLIAFTIIHPNNITYILCNESIRINLSFLSSHFSPQLN